LRAIDLSLPGGFFRYWNLGLGNHRHGAILRSQFQRQWFLVLLFVIEEAVQKISDGTITNYVHDPKAAAVVPTASGNCSD
jgi:hypothetical protein